MSLIAPNNRAGDILLIVEAVFAFLAIVAVCLRVWARNLKHMRLDYSDWTCIGALLVALLLLGQFFYNVTQGLGLPMEDVTPVQLANVNKAIVAGIIIWTTSTTLVRISTLLLYIRIFPVHKFIVVCWIFLAFNIIYVFATYIAALTICTPINYAWNQSIHGGHCGNRDALYLWHGVQNLIYDIVLVSLPMPLLWGLHLPVHQKLSLIFVFAFGYSICVITLARTVETCLARVARLTQDYVWVALLTTLEPLLGIINCSLPLLRPVSQKLFARFESTAGQHSSQDRDHVGLVQSIGAKRRPTQHLDPYYLDAASIHTIDDGIQIEFCSLSEGDGAPHIIALDYEERGLAN